MIELGNMKKQVVAICGGDTSFVYEAHLSFLKQKEIKYNTSRFKWIAPIYDVIEIFYAYIRKIVAEQQKLSQGITVIDVACGTGSQAIAFARRGV